MTCRRPAIPNRFEKFDVRHGCRPASDVDVACAKRPEPVIIATSPDRLSLQTYDLQCSECVLVVSRTPHAASLIDMTNEEYVRATRRALVKVAVIGVVLIAIAVVIGIKF